ncbi:penicillin-binding transpeptidase domain-containing protein [Roseomonas sp. CCTCC AB2023176]|uniref:penicillin-binding transpeptidase domain-containing protein n=1 Tax=Roseomonas sp. CCTCC AB2023176 TaxID=3342640 RepID=UPI0035D58773
MDFGDVSAWARPNRDGRLGAAPRRMADVVTPGDVVMVEILPAQPGQAGAGQGGTGARAAGRPERLALRQIPQIQGAISAIDPSTGRVLAVVGGWSFEQSWFNRATQAMRQPGSSFKPYVYVTALEQGIPPNQMLLDAPVEVNTPQGLWRPGNYDRTSSNGMVTMRQAMERSLNLVTVRLAQEVGMDKIAQTVSRLGVIPNMPRLLSMSLGAGEVTVMRQAAGYAAFVNGGRAVEPSLIDSVQDRFGNVVWRNDALRCQGCGGDVSSPPRLQDTRREALDPIAAYQMVSLLQGVVQRGTGTRAGQGLNRPIAGKTGTTNDYHDNWFVGFTPDIVIAVWVGFDDPRPLGEGETGGGNAAPIFHDVLEAALRDSPPVPFRAPPGVALVRVTTSNGQSILEPFRPGTENSARPPIGGGEVASASTGGSRGGTASSVDSSLGGLY